MLRRLLATAVFLTSTSTATAQTPPWKNEDQACPAGDELNRYIDVPMIPDLAATAVVANIPNLQLHQEIRSGNENKKWRIYFELLKPYDPKKEILILVPGGPGGPHTILHSVERLMAGSSVLDRYNVVSMDHRGVGCSRHLFPHDPPIQAYKMRFAAADIEEIRKHLGGENAKINLFGGSYGTMLGQTYALLYPKNLNRLVLNSAFSSYKDFVEADAGFESLLLDWNPGLRLQFDLIRNEDPDLADAFLAWAQSPMYSYYGRTISVPEKLAKVFELFSAKDIEGAKAEVKSQDWVMDAMMRAIVCQEIFAIPPADGKFHMFAPQFGACSEFKPFLDYFDYTESLANITARTFIYGGEFDHVTPAFAMRRMAAKIPNHFMFLDADLGHNVFEKPECAKRMLNAFFNDLPNAELRRLTEQSVCTEKPANNTAPPFLKWPMPQ